MSHEATIWAHKQRGLTANEYRILMCLADCHNPHFGCFPSQDLVASECELSRRQVIRIVDKLVQKGLLCVENRKGDFTYRKMTNRYYFAFESDFLAAQKRVSKTKKPCDILGKSHVTPMSHNPVIEPVRVLIEVNTNNAREGEVTA